MEGGKRIGAECTGRELNLTEACDQKCNFYEEDKWRTAGGVQRSFMPCNATDVKITECVQEDKMRDGKYDCKNRADEEAFGNSSLLLLDLENILIPCRQEGKQGFKCSGDGVPENCLRMVHWCQPDPTHTCNELKGTTATGKTIDPQLCSNQSFWEHKKCTYYGWYRCTGDTPGQCGHIKIKDFACKDGSSEIEPPQGGDCGDDLMCRAIKGFWESLNVCIKDQYKCDGVAHCHGEEDEANCIQNATEKCDSDCDKAHRAPSGGHCTMSPLLSSRMLQR